MRLKKFNENVNNIDTQYIKECFVEFFDEGAKFDDNYNELVKWIKENGRIPYISKISKDKTENRLSIWCGTQRQNKKRNLLNEDKIKKLVIPRNFVCVPVLIQVNGVSDEVQNANYFFEIIYFTEFLAK